MENKGINNKAIDFIIRDFCKDIPRIIKKSNELDRLSHIIGAKIDGFKIGFEEGFKEAFIKSYKENIRKCIKKAEEIGMEEERILVLKELLLQDPPVDELVDIKKIQNEKLKEYLKNIF